MPPEPPSKMRCRPIAEADLPAVAALLTKGFPVRKHEYWTKGLERLTRHATPPPYPKYGLILEASGVPVGVILLIFTRRGEDGNSFVLCNFSSWYVEEEFRAFASLLVASALRYRDVTFINISPEKRTFATIEAQGFKRYAAGQFIAAFCLSKRVEAVRVTEIVSGTEIAGSERNVDLRLLVEHAANGCVSLVCSMPSGSVYPFVFLPCRFAKGLIPGLQLVYCRNIQELQSCAREIGVFFLKRGLVFFTMDANERVPGLCGSFVAGKGPKYFKGPRMPTIGDLAYTEGTLFGY
jgi:hypothetical protein